MCSSRSRFSVPLVIVLVSILLSACGQETDVPVVNEAPFVQITGGPLNESVESYTARVFWTGWDNDGVLTHFQYALDPPPEFSEAEIAAPEKFDEIRIIIIPGPSEFADTMRVGKDVDGDLVTFDWVQTREFSRSFTFQTPIADSVFGGGGKEAGDTWSGAHRVFVRAQDNDENYSGTDFLGYTAFTIVPRSEINRPNIQSEISNMGPTVTVTWEGIDPDSPDPQKRPVGYLHRLLRLDTLEPPIPLSGVSSPQILFDKGDLIWTYQDAETTSLTLNLGTPGQYVFGVRAVDIAGSEEPFLDFGRNAFKFQAFANGGRPNLTISEPAVGSFTFRGIAPPQETEVPTGRRLRFTWQGNADEYGGTIEAYSWGLDIPDLDQEGPGSGWSAWGLTTGNFEPIVFTTAGIHVLYVRVRDVAGAITLATLIMNVIEFSFDKELLYVDDSFDDLKPRDNEHDAFWRDRISGYGGFSPEEVGEHHAHLDNDRGALSPVEPLLDEMGRYKLVVWECRGSGYNGSTALLKSTETRPTISSYIGAGGKLWIGGRMTVAATIATASGQNADLTYPKEELAPGDFAWDFFKLHSSRINNDKAGDQNGRHNIAKAIPFPGRPEIYPEMSVDVDKLNLAARLRGVSHADAVFDPLFAHSEPDFRGTIDSLYTYGSSAVHLLQPASSSTYENRLVAIRWHDPDPNRAHGRIQWFGFPLYFFYDNEAQETFNRSMDWFAQEQLDIP